MCPSCKKGIMIKVAEGITYAVYQCDCCGYRKTVVRRRQR